MIGRNKAETLCGARGDTMGQLKYYAGRGVIRWVLFNTFES
jgi:hypothetical protein